MVLRKLESVGTSNCSLRPYAQKSPNEGLITSARNLITGGWRREAEYEVVSELRRVIAEVGT